MSSCHNRQFGKSFDYLGKQLYLYKRREIIKINYKFNFKKMALEITDANFEELVEKSDKPVLLDFWAEWCGPCRMVGPVVEELSKDYDGKAVVGKVDVDSNSAISAKFGIRNIPTILFFKGGQVVDKQVGAVQKSVLDAKLKALF
jgi:thioredoxin 1